MADDAAPLSVSVTNGRVVINTIHLIHEAPGVFVLSGDLATKWAEVTAYGSNGAGNSFEIYIAPSERSVHVDETSTIERAVVRVSGLPPLADGLWLCSAEVSRYSLHIFLWTETTKEVPLLWDKELNRHA
jgi:hypothetical protein